MPYTLNEFCTDTSAILKTQPLATALPQIADRLSKLLVNPTFVAETFNDDMPPGKREKLSPEERARAFDRFWRADEARAGLGGSGLGLSIVEKLVRADGGSVALLDAPGHGLDAAITLPAALPAPARTPARQSI